MATPEQQQHQLDNINISSILGIHILCTGLRLPIAMNPLMQHIQESTVFKLVGSFQGKSFIDLACGNGHYCRLVKRQGASRVVGVDHSRAQIQQARQKEDIEPIGCSYIIGEAENLGKLGNFDIALGPFLLVYARTLDQLGALARTIYDNIKPGGCFVGLNLNCLVEPGWDEAAFEKYGQTFTVLPPIQGTVRIKVNFLPEKFMEDPHCEYGSNEHASSHDINFMFGPDVYETIFKEVGFRSLTFHPIVMQDEFLGHQLPEGFWDVYLDKPPHVAIVAKK